MTRTLQENLEVCQDGREASIRCLRCQHVLCSAAQDWRVACLVRTTAVPKIGPLPIVDELLASYRLKQLCCPTCGTLFSTELVESR